MLQVEGLTKNFGGLTAVGAVSMEVRFGELVGLIGPNGAGKTTLFNLLTGFLRPSAGKVMFEGRDITGRRPHSIASKGVIRSFQQDNVFADLTVLENVILAFHLKCGVAPWATVLNTRGCRRKEQSLRMRAQEILELTGIHQLAGAKAGSLAHGHKRMLGIAIALACEPRLLLLDEPLAGMNATEVNEAVALVRKLWERGLTILLIEHNMRAAMSLCQRFVVLNFGRKIAEGTPEQIKNHPDVVEAYLGTGQDVA